MKLSFDGLKVLRIWIGIGIGIRILDGMAFMIYYGQWTCISYITCSIAVNGVFFFFFFFFA